MHCPARLAWELALPWDKSELKQRLNHEPLPILSCLVLLVLGGVGLSGFFFLWVLFVFLFVHLTQAFHPLFGSQRAEVVIHSVDEPVGI